MDNKHFDIDVDNCFYLTNQEIISGNIKLTPEDAEFYRKYLSSLSNELEERKKRLKEGYEKTKEKQRKIHEEYEEINKILEAKHLLKEFSN